MICYGALHFDDNFFFWAMMAKRNGMLYGAGYGMSYHECVRLRELDWGER
jgi:hypothetical protein